MKKFVSSNEVMEGRSRMLLFGEFISGKSIISSVVWRVPYYFLEVTLYDVTFKNWIVRKNIDCYEPQRRAKWLQWWDKWTQIDSFSAKSDHDGLLLWNDCNALRVKYSIHLKGMSRAWEETKFQETKFRYYHSRIKCPLMFKKLRWSDNKLINPHGPTSY